LVFEQAEDTYIEKLGESQSKIQEGEAKLSFMAGKADNLAAKLAAARRDSYLFQLYGWVMKEFQGVVTYLEELSLWWEEKPIRDAKAKHDRKLAAEQAERERREAEAARRRALIEADKRRWISRQTQEYVILLAAICAVVLLIVLKPQVCAGATRLRQKWDPFFVFLQGVCGCGWVFGPQLSFDYMVVPLLVGLLPVWVVTDVLHQLCRAFVLLRFRLWYMNACAKKLTWNPWVPSTMAGLHGQSQYINVGPYHYQSCLYRDERGQIRWCWILRGMPGNSPWRKYPYEDTSVLHRLFRRPAPESDEGKTMLGAGDYRVRIFKPKKRDDH
jgi:hypothetical protein